MAQIEYNQLSAQLAKLGELCKDNGFQYRFEKDRYPIRIVITPDGSMDGQMSMLDNQVGHNSLGAALEFVFADGDLYLNPKGGGLSLTKSLQNKLRGIAEKIYFCYLQCFFIDTLQARKMQQIAEDAAPPEPEFEEIGERESLE